MFLSMLLCCAFFCSQSVQAQSVTAAKCSPEKIAACAKVCDSKAALTAAIGLTPQTVAVAQTETAAVPMQCKITNCDPADCPWICRILCPSICDPAAKTTMAKVETPSCSPAKTKTQLASID